MNFEAFQELSSKMQFGEVKIFGRDFLLDGLQVHIIAMAKGKEGMQIFALEETKPMSELGPEKRQTPRENMMRYISTDKSFIHIKEMKIGNCVLEIQGGNSGCVLQGEYATTYIFFVKMAELGWKIAAQSPFYQMDWEQIGLAVLNIANPPKQLPDVTEHMEFTTGTACKQHFLQIPIRLEIGVAQQITFTDDTGEQAVCYLNEIKLVNTLQKERERFDEPAYREKILQHCTQEQFEQMRDSLLEVLEQECPEGMCYIAIEYECTSDISLQFYAQAYLDTVQETKNHATSLFMVNRTEQELGPHQLKNRSWMIQYAVPEETTYLDAELLFSMRTIPEKTICIP